MPHVADNGARKSNFVSPTIMSTRPITLSTSSHAMECDTVVSPASASTFASRIPLPRNRMVPSTSSSALHSPAAEPSEEESPKHLNGQSSRKAEVLASGIPVATDGRSGFARRPSPPSNGTGDPRHQHRSPPNRTAAGAVSESIVSRPTERRRNSSPSKMPISPSRIPVAAASSAKPRSGSESASPRSSPTRQTSPSRKLSLPQAPSSRKGSQGEMAPTSSRIPLPKSSPTIPTVGWSLSPERMLPRDAERPRRSPPKEASVNIFGASSKGTNNGFRPKKQSEAFVMTGDIMINLAKTPAHLEFRSEYQRTDVVRMKFDFHDGANPNSVKQDRVTNGDLEDDHDISGIEYLEDRAGVAFDPFSPVTDTNSLISCSEHYNAGSVLGAKISPASSRSSPDAGEWSLMDSYLRNNSHNNGGEVLEKVSSPSDKSANSRNTSTTEDVDVNRTNVERQTVVIDVRQEQNKEHWSPQRHNLPDHNQHQSEAMLQQYSPQKSPVRPQMQLPTYGEANESTDDDLSIDSLPNYHPPVKVVDVPSAVRLAKRLYCLDGFRKTDVSRHLSKNTDYNHVVAEEYLKFFDFGHLSLDAALRQFLSHFCLLGETQERERVLIHFSQRFLQCNPGLASVLRSTDAVHTLACAILLLNTDLHGECVQPQRRMTCAEFCQNLSELNEGENFPRDLLKHIYAAIKEKPIPWVADELAAVTVSTQAQPPLEAQPSHPPPQRQQPQVRSSPTTPATTNQTTSSASVTLSRSGTGGINPFLQLPDPNQAVDYKNGYVMRKCCLDADGKRTKFGKRSWQMFFVALRDMVLFCFKDEKQARVSGAMQDPRLAIRIHHGLAVRATDYAKRQFVFRLHTADQAQYLFQTSDERELLMWIDVINSVVASFSAPQLAAPCGRDGFHRPLMPSSKTRLSPAEQLEAHEKQLMTLRDDLEELLQTSAAQFSSGKAAALVKQKKEFLKFEIMRYETYVLTLKTKNPSH